MNEKEINSIMYSLSELSDLPNTISSILKDTKTLADELINLRREINKHKAETLKLIETNKTIDEINKDLWKLVDQSVIKSPEHISCKNCLRYFYSYDSKDDEGLCYYCWFDEECKRRNQLNCIGGNNNA